MNTRQVRRIYIWLEDNGWRLALSLATCIVLAGLALLLAGCGRGASVTGPPSTPLGRGETCVQ